MYCHSIHQRLQRAISWQWKIFFLKELQDSTVLQGPIKVDVKLHLGFEE